MLAAEICRDPVINLYICPILDEWFDASSFVNEHPPHLARNTSDSAWIAEEDDLAPYIQMDLRWNDWASGVITWGLENTGEHVQTFRVEYRQNDGDWQSATDRDGNEVCFQW